MAEFAAVEVEELEKHLAEMMLGNEVSTLYLWHKLQHAHNQANHGETANSSIHRFIQTTHEQEVFDHSHQDRHGRILGLPLKERVDSIHTTQVLKRHINLETSLLVNVLHQRNSSVGNNLDRVLVGYVLAGEELLELVQPALCRQVRGGTASHEACRADDQIHVCGGEVEA